MTQPSRIVSQLVQLDRKVSELNNHRQAKCYNCLSGVQEANKKFKTRVKARSIGGK